MSISLPLKTLHSSLSIIIYLSHLYPKLAYILSLNRNKSKWTGVIHLVQLQIKVFCWKAIHTKSEILFPVICYLFVISTDSI